MENIKLVIWDLDDTFWDGTLSEGEVTPIEENIRMIKMLTDRGIVNSICSKNDFAVAEAKLRELGVWDYFVFPSIDWSTKGMRVCRIIKDMSLRAANVLFIDDNINNLKEAEFECEGLETTTPDMIVDLVKTSIFDGKDDKDHSRLQQYKLLEKRAHVKSESSSDDEFLQQSCIRCEIERDWSSQVDRAYELIHRTNQLNFTKNRISKDETAELLTKADDSGLVHVWDKYGDHGFVGFFAVKDGICLQFCFSCRTMGMGIEQYVYSQLGFPELEVVGEVAGGVRKGVFLTYINSQHIQKTPQILNTINKSADSTSLLVYGTCIMRPFESFWKNDYGEVLWDFFDSYPSVCNFMVGLRQNSSQINEWLENVNGMNSLTFDHAIWSGKYNFILVALDFELFNVYRYENKENPDLYFYSRNEENMFLESYAKTKLTKEILSNELCSLLDEMSRRGMKLIVINIPDIEWTGKGKDDEYNLRIQTNTVLDELSLLYSNLCLIDRRKIIKSASDLNDATTHQTRVKSYECFQRLLEIIVAKDEDINSTKDLSEDKLIIPSNAVRNMRYTNGNIEDVPSYVSYISNGVFCINIEIKNKEAYEYSITIFKNRKIVYEIGFTSEFSTKFNIDDCGLWYSKVCIRKVGEENKVYSFFTGIIELKEFNIFQFIHHNKNEMFDTDRHRALISLQETRRYNYLKYSQMLLKLSLRGVAFSHYFKERGITEISIVAGEMVLPLLLCGFVSPEVKIRNIFSEGDIWEATLPSGEQVRIQDIKKNVFTDKDNVLFAFLEHYTYYSKLLQDTKKSNAQVIDLPIALNYLCTKTFFEDELIFHFQDPTPLIMVVNVPNVTRIKNATAHEHAVYEFTTPAKVLQQPRERLPKHYEEISRDVLEETMISPEFYRRSDGIMVMKNKEGKYLNIENGFRCTCGSPDKYVGTIYLFGDSLTFGLVRDEDTISSALQRIIRLPYRVMNYSNMSSFTKYDDAIALIKSLVLCKNDIIILLCTNTHPVLDMGHWFTYGALSNNFIKIDATGAIEQKGNKSIYLLQRVLNAEGNKIVAEVIRDAIYDHITLFSMSKK